jgi:hypothetical protein
VRFHGANYRSKSGPQNGPQDPTETMGREDYLEAGELRPRCGTAVVPEGRWAVKKLGIDIESAAKWLQPYLSYHSLERHRGSGLGPEGTLHPWPLEGARPGGLSQIIKPTLQRSRS